jgi:hypothetical protein
MKMLGAIAAGLLLLGTTTAGFAADKDADDPSATITTLFVDGKGQSGFAEKVNKIHAEMAAKGWKFAGLDLYTENGDMKGVFVTYTR